MTYDYTERPCRVVRGEMCYWCSPEPALDALLPEDVDVEDIRMTGLEKALDALMTELVKLDVPTDRDGYFGLVVGYRGVDRVRAAVGYPVRLFPDDDIKWLPTQRGDLAGWRLLEQFPE